MNYDPRLVELDVLSALVEEYEKKYKPTYLNVYYNNGLLIKTYAQSIKEEKEYKKMLEENKD